MVALSGGAFGAEFKDAAGRVTGSSRTDMNGVTHFYDGANRVTGSARTDMNGVTRFYDAAARVTGTMRSTGKR
jgi:YD repeat-containing protein